MNVRQAYSDPREIAYRAVLTIGAKDAVPSESFAQARDVLMDWLGQFTLANLGVPLANVSGINTPTEFRVEEPKAGFRVFDSADAGDLSPYGISYWEKPDGLIKRGEFTLRLQGDRVLFEEHLATSEETIIPEVTLFLAKHGLVYDAEKSLPDRAKHVDDHRDLAELWSRLTNPHRNLPVVVASEPLRVDVADLAERLRGSAHVYSIGKMMTFALRELAGRDFAVFGGAVRFYGDLRSSSQHYVMLSKMIDAAELSGRANDLIDAAAYRALRNMNDRVSLRPYGVRDVELALRRPAAAPQGTPGLHVVPDLLPAPELQVPAIADPASDPKPNELERELEDRRSEDEAAALRETIRRLKDDYDVLETNYLTLLEDSERAQSRAESEAQTPGADTTAYHPIVTNLLSSIELLYESAHDIQRHLSLSENEIERSQREAQRLRVRLSRLEKALGPAPLERPTTLDPDAVDAWVDRRFDGRLELHQRAIAALAGSQYDNVEEVLRGLEILGDEYHAMRLRTTEDGAPKHAFEEVLRSEHLRFTGAISDAEYGSYRRLYTLPYRGTERRLDFHLRNGGGTSDPKRCLRIYFFWDDDLKKVVVGHLPSHLPNSLS